VITTGDLARVAERQPDFLDLKAAAVMTRAPKTTPADVLAAAVTGQMERIGIVAMPVVEGDQLVGVVHLHDLLQAGAV
jgi:arabinose-5-phosphate isomerase